jgi:hypothetical protein
MSANHRAKLEYSMQATVLRSVVLAVVACLSLTANARAVPAFADQTGLHCAQCHVGAFGPQLTPVGRAFKLGGYTLRSNDSAVPIAAMAIVSYLHTQADQSVPPAKNFATNDNVAIDQLSLFLAGGYGDRFGGFSQFTYDGVGKSVGWDNLDLRAVDTTKLFDADTTFGLSLNNNPGVQDVWATLPAWGFPFTSSALAPAPAAAPLFDGALAQNVVGLTAYVWWDNSIYAEAGAYRSLSQGTLRFLGADPAGTDLIDGATPYIRIAYQRDMGPHDIQVGAFALLANVFPGRDKSTGATDRLHDFGVDASYQFDSDENLVTANARFTHEDQELDASRLLGLSENRSDALNEMTLDASYYWDNTIGITVSHFQTWGSRDTLLYASNRTNKPDSDGFVFQIDGTPWGKDGAPFGNWVNLRAGLQYTLYTRFDGASSNFDGAGTEASANNTLRLFLWLAF